MFVLRGRVKIPHVRARIASPSLSPVNTKNRSNPLRCPTCEIRRASAIREPYRRPIVPRRPSDDQAPAFMPNVISGRRPYVFVFYVTPVHERVENLRSFRVGPFAIAVAYVLRTQFTSDAHELAQS